MLDHLRSDVRSAFRRLRTSPGYAAVSILTLGLGIGASTAIFSAVDGVLLKSLPYRDPESLVQMWESSAPRKFDSFPVTPSDLAEWRTQARSVREKGHKKRGARLADAKRATDTVGSNLPTVSATACRLVR